MFQASYTNERDDLDLNIYKRILTNWDNAKIELEFLHFSDHPKRSQCILKKYFKELSKRTIPEEDVSAVLGLFPVLKKDYIIRGLRKYDLMTFLRKLTYHNSKIRKHREMPIRNNNEVVSRKFYYIYFFYFSPVGFYIFIL